MSIGDLLFGKPLSSYEDSEQRLRPAAGIGIFGLDALSSAAYGPEAALTLLIPLGALALQYIVPISFSIDLNQLSPGQYDCQVTVLNPTSQKGMFWQAPVMLVP